MWTLISYSRIEVPLAPFEPGYTVGIVESEDGKRAVALIPEAPGLRIGMAGKLKASGEGKHQKNIFWPEVPLSGDR